MKVSEVLEKANRGEGLTVEEIKMNVAYRWFLGYLMNEQIPHFSTVSYMCKHVSF